MGTTRRCLIADAGDFEQGADIIAVRERFVTGAAGGEPDGAVAGGWVAKRTTRSG